MSTRPFRRAVAATLVAVVGLGWTAPGALTSGPCEHRHASAIAPDSGHESHAAGPSLARTDREHRATPGSPSLTSAGCDHCPDDLCQTSPACTAAVWAAPASQAGPSLAAPLPARPAALSHESLGAPPPDPLIPPPRMLA